MYTCTHTCIHKCVYINRQMHSLMKNMACSGQKYDWFWCMYVSLYVWDILMVIFVFISRVIKIKLVIIHSTSLPKCTCDRLWTSFAYWSLYLPLVIIFYSKKALELFIADGTFATIGKTCELQMLGCKRDQLRQLTVMNVYYGHSFTTVMVMMIITMMIKRPH